MRRKFIAFILFLFVCRLAVFAQPVASARVEQGTIKIGEQTTLHLRVITEKGDKVTMPVLKDTLNAKVQIVKSSIDTVESKDNPRKQTVSQHLIITSFEPGTYTFPSYKIITSQGDVQTPPVTFVVQTVQVDTTKAFYDIKEPMSVSYTFWDWVRDNWYWILLVLTLLVIASFVIRYFIKRKKKGQSGSVNKPVLPEDTLAINKLEELETRALWQNNEQKQYYIELTDILREYLEKRYRIQAMEQTSEETMKSLKQIKLAKEDRARLSQILVLADLVKFARTQALPEENIDSMAQAKIFVMNTKRKLTVNPSKNGTV